MAPGEEENGERTTGAWRNRAEAKGPTQKNKEAPGRTA